MSNYAFPCIVAGKMRWLRFRGAKAHEGYYTTANAEEQRAIESHMLYKLGKITLAGEYSLDSLDREQLENNNSSFQTPNSSLDNNSQLTQEVPEVTTVQGAREWLLQHIEGCKVSELPNREAVLAYAASHGVKFGI